MNQGPRSACVGGGRPDDCWSPWSPRHNASGNSNASANYGTKYKPLERDASQRPLTALGLGRENREGVGGGAHGGALVRLLHDPRRIAPEDLRMGGGARRPWRRRTAFFWRRGVGNLSPVYQHPRPVILDRCS